MIHLHRICRALIKYATLSILCPVLDGKHILLPLCLMPGPSIGKPQNYDIETLLPVIALSMLEGRKNRI